MSPQSIILSALRGYKRWISPLLPAACRFYPTCSDYSAQAVEIHGAIRGVGLTIWRLGRCHPLCRGGFDPVPPKRASSAVDARQITR